MSSFIERQKVGGRDSYMPHKHIPLRLIIFLLSSLSIISLLLYFLGVGSFVTLALVLFLIEAIAFIGILVVARGVGEARRLLTLGLWAGALATLAYDVVRIPVAHSGIPVFKAISYFGTVLLGVQAPTPLSETLGWAYHLSNGVSFGLMYAALVSKPRIYSAIIWGLTLEAVMLMTPYAEVFGYRRDAKFFVITIGAHAVYGAVLYLGLQLWQGTAAFSLKPSPPAYIGPHLYTTWDVPEPDRIVAMWMTRRFVDPKATFYFIKPFERIRYGQPFDIPEAEIRRHGIESATQFLVARQGLSSDKKLDAFARMTYLNEITPWMLASDPQAGQLTQQLRLAAEQHCGEALRPECTESLF